MIRQVEEKLELSNRANFWSNRKPIYKQISKAKYERIVQGDGFRAIVETNPYFRVKQKINRLYGTAISCYVLFNRAYWFNKATNQYMSMQLNRYVKRDMQCLSIHQAHYASNRNSRDWAAIEFEWLLREELVNYRDLETYSFHKGDHSAFGKIFEKIVKDSTNLELLGKVSLLLENGYIKETNENLYS